MTFTLIALRQMKDHYEVSVKDNAAAAKAYGELAEASNKKRKCGD